LKIVEAIPLAGEGAAEPGRVARVKENPAVFGVGTGGGVLGVMKVQLEGKRVMTAAEFLRGQRQFVGALLS
jgi:methionyl-tRNA formyltransferase